LGHCDDAGFDLRRNYYENSRCLEVVVGAHDVLDDFHDVYCALDGSHDDLYEVAGGS
jgi:hypothetical protein